MMCRPREFPRQELVIALLGAVTFLPLAVAAPRQDERSWENLKQLAPNEQVRIVLNEAKSYRGEFQGVSDGAIVVRVATGIRTFVKENVLRVSTKGAAHLRRNVLIWAAVGFGAGTTIVAVACLSNDCKGAVAPILGATVGAPVGALVGFVMPTGGWHDVYRAR
jgi:hypothetical protein